MEKNNKKTLLIIIITLSLIILGLLLYFTIFNNKSDKEEKTKEENNKTEINAKNNETINLAGLKIDTVYETKIYYYDYHELNDDSDDEVIGEGKNRIVFLGTGQFIEQEINEVTNYIRFGTYSINDGMITKNYKYKHGSDCSIVKDETTYGVDVKNILTNYDENEKLTFSDLLTADICESDDINAKMPSSFEYINSTNGTSARMELLPFNYYIMKICFGKTCGISFGTYKDSNNQLTFNQSIYSNGDCYESQKKEYTATYTKITESREYLQVSDYKDVTIDLTNSYIINGKYTLKDSEDELLYDLINNKSLFNKYCK